MVQDIQMAKRINAKNILKGLLNLIRMNISNY